MGVDQGARAHLDADTSEDPDTIVQIPTRVDPVHELMEPYSRDTSGRTDTIHQRTPQMDRRTPRRERISRETSEIPDTMSADRADT